MNKKKLVRSLTLSAFVLVGGALVLALLPKATHKTLRINADTPYSCTLPNDYVEIDTVINKIITEAYAEAIDNPYCFRGTVTKRVGDMAFLQRVNQSTYCYDAIRITGLNDYADEIEEGNVVDILGGRLALQYLVPTVILNDVGQCYVAYSSNPYGYQPLVYEGVADYFTNGLETSTSHADFRYAQSRYIQVNGVVPDNFDVTPKSTFGDQEWSAGFVFDIDDTSSSLNIIAPDDCADEVDEKIELAISTNKMINVRGVAYHYAYTGLLINSADDVTVTSAPSFDTDVVSSRRSMRIIWGADENQLINISTITAVGYGDVPYVEVGAFILYRNWLILENSSDRYPTQHTIAGKPYQMAYGTEDTGYYLFDTQNDTITIIDNDGTINHMRDRTATGVRAISFGGETQYCSIDGTRSVSHNVYGDDRTYLHEFTFDLGQFGLDIVMDKYNNVYAPITVLSDILFMESGYALAYNGKDMYFIHSEQNDSNVRNMYYVDSPWISTDERSAEMAEFTYNALCFDLRYFYGLYEIRGSVNPDTLLTSLGVKDKLLSTSAYEYEMGVTQFAGQWLYEGHAGYLDLSPFIHMTDSDPFYALWGNFNNYRDNNARRQQLAGTASELNDARDAAGKGVGLSIYDDTAIITFDRFTKYYEDSATIDVDNYSYEDLQDMGSELLFKKAFKEIDDIGGIHNVVFDVTINGGGAVDTLPWLQAYMTENPSLTINYRLTGECDEVYYKLDLNYDGVFGGVGDTYQGQFDFYCMSSRYSFSCGNAFPTILKSKGIATLIGERSGGGVCAVGMFASASGSIFRNSSNYQIGYYDGSTCQFTCFEDGIEPDHPFSRANFYDDEAIYNFIHSL